MNFFSSLPRVLLFQRYEPYLACAHALWAYFSEIRCASLLNAPFKVSPCSILWRHVLVKGACGIQNDVHRLSASPFSRSFPKPSLGLAALWLSPCDAKSFFRSCTLVGLMETSTSLDISDWLSCSEAFCVFPRHLLPYSPPPIPLHCLAIYSLPAALYFTVRVP